MKGFRVSSDPADLQFERVHNFLSKHAYWCLEIPASTLKKALAGSLCFGLYEDKPGGSQAGFARVVTDGATFAWLCDVYVEEEFRGKGLATGLIECVVAHPQLKGLRRFLLATKDAHGLYKKFGFQVTATPNYWMEIKDNELYQKQAGTEHPCLTKT